MRILRDVRAHLAARRPDYQLIAPAYFGFNGPACNAFNTGYLVLPAFAEFARVDDEAFWKGILRDSQKLLDNATFSSFKLPADWVALENGQVTIAASRSAFFGFEAIRLPLYLAWHGARDRLASFTAYLDFVERTGYLPIRVNVIDGSVAADEAPAGFHAVMGLCAERLGRAALAQKLFQDAATRISREPKDYYSNTLFLLATGKLDPN